MLTLGQPCHSQTKLELRPDLELRVPAKFAIPGSVGAFAHRVLSPWYGVLVFVKFGKLLILRLLSVLSKTSRHLWEDTTTEGRQFDAPDQH